MYFVGSRQQCDLSRCSYNLRAYACQLIDRLRLSFDSWFVRRLLKLISFTFPHILSIQPHRSLDFSHHFIDPCNVTSFIFIPLCDFQTFLPPFVSKNPRLSWPLLICNLSLTILAKIELFTFCVVAFCV